MEEEEDLGGIGVAFCESEEVEVVVADVEVLFVGRRPSVSLLRRLRM